MNSDDQTVLSYLESFKDQFVSHAEVSKRAAGKRRFSENPDWARAILARLALQNILEVNAFGQYRIKPKGGKKKDEEQKKHTPRPDPEVKADEVVTANPPPNEEGAAKGESKLPVDLSAKDAKDEGPATGLKAA